MHLAHATSNIDPKNSPQVAVRLLGGVAVRTRDGEWLSIRSRREAVVLARLAISETVVGDTVLAEAVWADELPATWNASLRNAIAKVRSIVRASSDDYDIKRLGAGYRLELCGNTSDVNMVGQLLDTAGRDLETNPTKAVVTLSQIRSVLDRSLDRTICGEWTEPMERRLVEQRRRALVMLADIQIASGHPEEALTAAAELITQNEFDETGYRLAMRANVDAGQRVGALRAYEQCRVVMRDEFGVAPSQETEELYLTLLGDETATPLPEGLSRCLRRVLLGRDGEINSLERGWSRARVGESVSIVIAGEAGIGKTRLLAELARQVAEEGGHVCYGSAADFKNSASRLRTMCSTAPTLLALDDLQHKDNAGTQVTEDLMRLRIPGLAIVALSRPAFRHHGSFAGDSVDLRIELGGLDASAVADLIRHETNSVPDPADAQQLTSDTGGNPLYMVELLANGLSEALSLGHPDQGGLPEVPPTIRQVVAERVESLSTNARLVLDAAAVLASRIEVRTLLEMVDLEPSTTLDAIHEAQEAGILRTVGSQPGSLQFVDAVTRASIELELAWGRRVSLHQRAAEALERDPLVGRAAPQLLAHHYGAAVLLGCWRECVKWSRVAVDRATSQGQHAQAAVRLGDTLFSLAEAGDPDPKLRVEFEIDLAVALGRFGAPEAVEVARDAHRSALAHDAVDVAASLRQTLRNERLVPTDLVDELDELAGSVTR